MRSIAARPSRNETAGHTIRQNQRGQSDESTRTNTSSTPLRNGRRPGWDLPVKLSSTLSVSNRQFTRSVDTRHLRRLVGTLLTDLLELKAYEIGVTLVSAPQMTRLNETFLRHEGATDVITFDHSEAAIPSSPSPISSPEFHGELFICVDEAVLQAKRFRTTWQSEIVRYCIHGVLHLFGHHDHRAGDRRRMKRKENQLLRQLAKRFRFAKLASTSKQGHGVSAPLIRLPAK